MNLSETRAFLGPGASLGQVAEALGVSVSSLRKSLSAKERSEWAQAIKTDSKDHLTHAIRKVKVQFLRLGRIPSARESKVHSSIMTELGGYLEIVRASGLRKWEDNTPVKT